MNDFTEKIERRKRMKDANRRKYLEGRYNRRTLTTGGAFGQFTSKLYNMCVMGTTASEKRDKSTRSDYEIRADYDS